MVTCNFYIPLSDTNKHLKIDYLNARYSIEASAFNFDLFIDINKINFTAYQIDYGIVPIISINKNGDVKIGNEIFNSIWHNVPGSARDLFGWEWTDERFGEYIVERIHQLIFVPAGSRDDFRLWIGDNSGRVRITHFMDKVTLIYMDDVFLSCIWDHYHIARQRISQLIGHKFKSYTFPLCPDEETVYKIINYINENYKSGNTTSASIDTVTIGRKQYEIKQTKKGGYYLADFPAAEHRVLLKSYIIALFPGKRFVGVFPEFETKTELLKFVSRIKDDRRFSERKDR